MPLKAAFTVKPPAIVAVSAVVRLRVVAPEMVRRPVTDKLPTNVFVFVPLNVNELGHVTPLLVIVEVALIVIPDVPAIV